MLNLILKSELSLDCIPIQSDESCDKLLSSCISVDSSSGFVYAALSRSNQTCVSVFAIHQQSSLLDLALIASIPDSSGFPTCESLVMVGLQSLPESNSLCIAMRSGEILLLHLNQLQELDHIETVGSIDGGIEAWSWSPDLELVVFISGKS